MIYQICEGNGKKLVPTFREKRKSQVWIVFHHACGVWGHDSSRDLFLETMEGRKRENLYSWKEEREYYNVKEYYVEPNKLITLN